MQDTQNKDELYAITKVVSDYVHPFVSALDDSSPAELEMAGGISEDEHEHQWYAGLVTREPGSEGYGLVFNRRVVVCLYDSHAESCRIFSNLYAERYRLSGVVSFLEQPIDSGELTARFMETVYSVTTPFETMVDTALGMMDRDPEAYPEFPVSGPRDLYAFLTRVMVTVMQSMPDPAGQVVEELGFVRELEANPDGEGWERLSLGDFQKKLLDLISPEEDKRPPNCFSLVIQ